MPVVVGSIPTVGSGHPRFSPIAQWWSVRLLSGGFQVRVLVGEPRGSSLKVKRLRPTQDRAEFESRLPLLFSVRNDGRAVMQRFAKPSSGVFSLRRFDSSSFRFVSPVGSPDLPVLCASVANPKRWRSVRIGKEPVPKTGEGSPGLCGFESHLLLPLREWRNR